MSESNFQSRLETFLTARSQPVQIEQLTPDASTREYYRVQWNGGLAIACVYPESFVAGEQTYLDVTNLFLRGGLPVAKIFDFDEQLGIIIQEDFGNTILRDVLLGSSPERREELIDEAIVLIARIQSITDLAYEVNSIASRLKFDEEKLLWELNFFREHYFESFRKSPLSQNENDALTEEFLEIVRELESHARVLTHRDFHAANLMLTSDGELRIIDHQDARIGTVSYDLVSLLLDRVSGPPDKDWVRAKRAFLLSEREKLGLAPIEPETFAAEFHLQTIQRCLKATGTFSYQSIFRDKVYFIPYIRPTLQIVLEACERLGRFPYLAEILKKQIDEK